MIRYASAGCFWKTVSSTATTNSMVRVVVVVQDDPEQRRLLQLLLGSVGDVGAALAAFVRHATRKRGTGAALDLLR